MSVGTVIVAIDGSDPSLHAAQVGFALLQAADRVVVVTVIEPNDPTLAVGTGFASGVMSVEEVDRLDAERRAQGESDVDAAATALGVADVERLVIEGQPGPDLCALAEQRSADVIVMGTRGRGGIKRAVLGSVSDFVVRNAPCPVVICRPSE